MSVLQAKPKGRHGGARPGAGRKSKMHVATTIERLLQELPVVCTGNPLAANDITDRARRLASVALETLGKIANSPSFSAKDRIKAATAILMWAYGKPLGTSSPTRTNPQNVGEKLGKKKALQLAADNPSEDTPIGKILAAKKYRMEGLN